MFFAFVAFVVAAVLTCEFFYLRSLIDRVLGFWGLDTQKRKIKIIKYSIMAVIMGMSAFVFTVPGLWALHTVIIAGATDLICLLFRLIFKKGARVCRFIACSAIIPVVLGTAAIVYGYINIHSVVGTEYTVKTEKALTRGYKIAFLSDLHYGVSLDMEELKKACDAINEQQPDLFLLGGDIVDESTPKEELNQVFATLGGVKSTFGTYFVYGNHDNMGFAGVSTGFTKSELENAITQAGITILEDQVVEITPELVLVGRRDASFRGDEKAKSRASIEELTKEIDRSKYILLLDHQPRELALDKKAGVDLVLSGHTHAGQLFPAESLTTVIAPNDLAYGHAIDGDFNAIVSSGIAGWGFPIKTSRYAEYLIVSIEG